MQIHFPNFEEKKHIVMAQNSTEITAISLKWNWASHEAENDFVVLQFSRISILQGFNFTTHIFLKIIKGQGTLEGGVEVVASKYLPRTYFSL